MRILARPLMALFVSSLFSFGADLIAPSGAEAAKKKVKITAGQEREIRRELERRFGRNIARQIEQQARQEARRRGLF